MKHGPAAFMKTEEDAQALAQALVDTARGLGIRTSAVLSRMDCPVGTRVGNAQEVIEAVNCLKEGHPGIFKHLE